MRRRAFLQSAAAGAASTVLFPYLPAGGFAEAEQTATIAPGWWMTEPIRWLQTNLRETNSSLDPKKFIDDVVAFHANVLMLNAGGITAHYPSNVQYEYVSPYLPKGRDMFGEVLKEAHARKIRVVSRWDFSKTHKDVFDAHPEWFFRMTDGQPAIYNGLYLACINGDWYHKKALEILTEALDRYDVDGCFFNMFSNPATDYSERQLGLCHCDNCERLYRQRFNRSIPEVPDADYRAFLYDSGTQVSIKIRDVVRNKRPKAALLGTAIEIGDIAYGEANTAVRRPLPLWPYSAADNSNRWKNSYPDKGTVCQGMSFIDFPWRFATVPQAEVRTRVWQDVANGGAAAFNLHGTIAEQQDKEAIKAAVPAYGWLAQHEQYFVGQASQARVVLLAPHSGGTGFRISQDAYRGMFRLLSEQHIPFAAMENLNWIGKRDIDLVICPGLAPLALDRYINEGGRVIVASAATPEFEVAPTVKVWKSPDGAYFRIRDKAMFPSFSETDVVFMYGDYTQVNAAKPPVTFIPPSLYGPPELVGVNWSDTDDPGLVIRNIGKGKIAWLPWDIATLYYRHSSQAHSKLLGDLIDHLLPAGRQVTTNAHPLVQITFMRQQNRYLMHFINLTGHADTAYFDPIPMSEIRVRVQASFRSAKSLRANQTIAVESNAGYSEFTLPKLDEYELVHLE